MKRAWERVVSCPERDRDGRLVCSAGERRRFDAWDYMIMCPHAVPWKPVDQLDDLFLHRYRKEWDGHVSYCASHLGEPSFIFGDVFDAEWEARARTTLLELPEGTEE